MDDRDIGFVLGFIAGEGSFYVNVCEASTECGLRFSPEFTLKVNEVDTEVLGLLSELTQVGKIRPEQNNCVRWRVDTQGGCRKLVSDIETASQGTLFRESSKYESFRKWRYFVENDISPQTKAELREALEKRNAINTTGHGGQTVEEWLDRSTFE